MNCVKLFSLILLVSSAKLFAAEDTPNWKKRLQQAGELVVSETKTHPGVSALGLMAVTAYATDSSVRESVKSIAYRTYDVVSSEIAKDPISGTLKVVAVGGLVYKVLSYGAKTADNTCIYLGSNLKTDLKDAKEATVAGYDYVINKITEYPKTSAVIGITAGVAGLAYLGKKVYDKYYLSQEAAAEKISKEFLKSLNETQAKYAFGKMVVNDEIDLNILLKDSVFKAMLTENQLNIVKSLL